ncbi:MAG: hypothetical protein K2F59_06250 [Eubacteriales bacterium]|nr:hypothetical protein [Eubacteriales bacterium]
MKGIKKMVKNYLERKINNWYINAEMDYGVTGKFIDAKVIDKEHLLITWEENGETEEMVINYFETYSQENLYNIWIEG